MHIISLVGLTLVLAGARYAPFASIVLLRRLGIRILVVRCLEMSTGNWIIQRHLVVVHCVACVGEVMLIGPIVCLIYCVLRLVSSI